MSQPLRISNMVISIKGIAQRPRDASMDRYRRDISNATVLDVCFPLVFTFLFWRKSGWKFVPGGVFSCVLYGQRHEMHCRLEHTKQNDPGLDAPSQRVVGS